MWGRASGRPVLFIGTDCAYSSNWAVEAINYLDDKKMDLVAMLLKRTYNCSGRSLAELLPCLHSCEIVDDFYWVRVEAKVGKSYNCCRSQPSLIPVLTCAPSRSFCRAASSCMSGTAGQNLSHHIFECARNDIINVLTGMLRVGKNGESGTVDPMSKIFI